MYFFWFVGILTFSKSNNSNDIDRRSTSGSVKSASAEADDSLGLGLGGGGSDHKSGGGAKLNRRLTLLSGVSFVVGTMIGIIEINLQ